jgi:hypothetical protein
MLCDCDLHPNVLTYGPDQVQTNVLRYKFFYSKLMRIGHHVLLSSRCKMKFPKSVKTHTHTHTHWKGMNRIRRNDYRNGVWTSFHLATLRHNKNYHNCLILSKGKNLDLFPMPNSTKIMKLNTTNNPFRGLVKLNQSRKSAIAIAGSHITIVNERTLYSTKFNKSFCVCCTFFFKITNKIFLCLV